MRITIIGAGIVGLATAHAMLDRGYDVVLVEPGGKQGRPTDGNAGWIAHTDIMPLASPKAWRNLPRWMLDPLGPLTIRPGYLPSLAPWLVRFLLASSPHRIEAGIKAIRAINAEALPAWRDRLASLNLGGHLRENGILSVWRNRADFQRSESLFARQRGFGIGVEVLDPAELAALEPALHNVEAAVLYPDACHMSDPADLAADLLRLARERGAVHAAGHALAIEPGRDAVLVRTDSAGDVTSDRVVVSAGVWSRSLAGQMGDRIPLDTERGYNATYPKNTFGLGRPVMYEGEGFVTTPLDTGDRVGGAVEFAGTEARPNHERTSAMVRRLKRFLPHVETEAVAAKRWMGFRPSIPDSLPVIGKARRDERVVYAFGHGHHGLTQAAVTSQMVAGLIDGRGGPVDATPFSAQRF